MPSRLRLQHGIPGYSKGDRTTRRYASSRCSRLRARVTCSALSMTSISRCVRASWRLRWGSSDSEACKRYPRYTADLRNFRSRSTHATAAPPGGAYLTWGYFPTYSRQRGPLAIGFDLPYETRNRGRTWRRARSTFGEESEVVGQERRARPDDRTAGSRYDGAY